MLPPSHPDDDRAVVTNSIDDCRELSRKVQANVSHQAAGKHVSADCAPLVIAEGDTPFHVFLGGPEYSVPVMLSIRRLLVLAEAPSREQFLAIFCYQLNKSLILLLTLFKLFSLYKIFGILYRCDN